MQWNVSVGIHRQTKHTYICIYIYRYRHTDIQILQVKKTKPYENMLSHCTLITMLNKTMNKCSGSCPSVYTSRPEIHIYIPTYGYTNPSGGKKPNLMKSYAYSLYFD